MEIKSQEINFNIVSSGENTKDNPIPKDTETIIKQAEVAMEKQKDDIKISQQTSPKKSNQLYRLQMAKI